MDNIQENAPPTVSHLLNEAGKKEFDLRLTCISGRKGVKNTIGDAINRPGLALNKYFFEFGEKRIQLFGRGEHIYLHELEKQGKLRDVLLKLFEHDIPCCLISHIDLLKPPSTLIEMCEEHDCPLLTSPLSTNELSISLYRLLNHVFCSTQTVSGTLIEVFDIGVLILGDSGVGKSETALELLAKGPHRLVADDVVSLNKLDGNTIFGTSVKTSQQYKHHLEVRGLGVVSISQIYGFSSTLEKKQLNLVIKLLYDVSVEEYEQSLNRLGEEKRYKLLDVEFPLIEILVRPGRNIPILIEVAALQHRIRVMGYHSKEDPFVW